MARKYTLIDNLCGEADRRITAVLEGDAGDENSRKLRRILLKIINNELTARQKEIIMLYYFKGEDVASISRRLGISQKGVYGCLARARKSIYRILQYYF